ncbi:MAG: hypothetical protein K8R53_09985, partial [Bacteroidales bacterium]|nr:hypothetical protein [Bacteroidales bacterium]
MSKYHLLSLSVLSGLIFTLAWPINGFPALLFFAFVPLLVIENYIYSNKKSYLSLFLYSYIAFIIWNALTTWWIWNSTPVAIAAWILNSLFMSIVFLLFHATRRKVFNVGKGYIVLFIYWLAFEYLHLNWELSWSLLNLGNGFAAYYKWIQWYEYT